MFCKECGKEIPNDSNFCLYCGISLYAINTNELIKKGMSLIVIKNEKKFGWGRYRISIFVDGDFIKDVKNGEIVSFEIENGNHIIFCESKWCNRSDPVEIKAICNEIHFSATYEFSVSAYYKVLLKKKKQNQTHGN